MKQEIHISFHLVFICCEKLSGKEKLNGHVFASMFELLYIFFMFMRIRTVVSNCADLLIIPYSVLGTLVGKPGGPHVNHPLP